MWSRKHLTKKHDDEEEQLFGVNNGNFNDTLSLQTLPLSGTEYKVAAALKKNNGGITKNSESVLIDSLGQIPAFSDNIKIGNRQDFSSLYNGTIIIISYYPARLTNENLQALTS